MIAADGAQSTIRERLGLSFAGKSAEQTYLLADLQADMDWPDDEFHIFASGDGLAGLFPLGKGRYRLIADHAGRSADAHEPGYSHTQGSVPPHPDGSPISGVSTFGQTPPHARDTAAPSDRPATAPRDRCAAAPAPTLDECRQIVAKRVHHPMTLTDLQWSGYLHLHRRMVEQLRVNRIFLAGDAAHVHSPAGAQGMNAGIQEALNLGWKLACVLRHGAPQRLLDTYHLERHPIEREVLRQSSFLTHVAEADHGPLKLLRERVMPVLASLGPLRDAARLRVSELAIQYRRSPLTLERVLDGGPRAGERAPDALVHVIDGPLGRAPGTGCIFDLHDPAYFSLFILVPPDAADDVLHDIPHGAPQGAPQGAASPGVLHKPARVATADLDRFTAEVGALLPDAVRIWRVTDASGEGGPSLAESYGRTRPSFYFVRPDGYVCVRGRAASDLNGLLRHCEAWLVKGQPEESPPLPPLPLG
jgi:2-polyprenyl-6-methoxyphenol hydroxylase-like FAD-dependent oxidoreductase